MIDLAAEYGTPLFVYDEAHLRNRCREAVARVRPRTVVYATKAFLCKAMASSPTTRGCCSTSPPAASCTSPWRPACPPTRCTMHGNNKSVDELRMAMTAGVRHIVVDSFDEMDRLDALHAEGLPAPTCCCASPPACTRTPTSSSPPARTTASSASTSATATRSGRRPDAPIAERCARRRALPHRLERVRGIELRQGRRGDGHASPSARPARAGARRWPRRRLRRGRGSADHHPVGQRAARRLRGAGRAQPT